MVAQESRDDLVLFIESAPDTTAILLPYSHLSFTLLIHLFIHSSTYLITEWIASYMADHEKCTASMELKNTLGIG